MPTQLPYIAILVFALSGFAGCTEQQNSKEITKHQPSIPATQINQQEEQVSFMKTFTGAINGKYGITMTLTRKDNELFGNYFYNKINQPIPLTGVLDKENRLTLQETDDNGNIAGIFKGELSADFELAGFWTKTGSNKQLPFELHESTSEKLAPDVEVVEYSFSVKGKEDALADFSFPRVNGADTEIVAKINKLLSVESLTNETEEQIRKTFEECSCGTVSSDYVVNYNKRGVLSITVVAESVGAYSSFNTRNLNINTITGTLITIEQLLLSSALEDLAKRCDRVLQKEIARAKQQASEIGEREWANELLADKKFEKIHLADFTIHENGITFNYPFDFPHAALAFQPQNAIGFTFEQLSSFIDPNGLLSKEKK